MCWMGIHTLAVSCSLAWGDLMGTAVYSVGNVALIRRGRWLPGKVFPALAHALQTGGRVFALNYPNPHSSHREPKLRSPLSPSEHTWLKNQTQIRNDKNPWPFNQARPEWAQWQFIIALSVRLKNGKSQTQQCKAGCGL